MLSLTRKSGQSIKIGDNIEIKIGKFKGKSVSIQVCAPRSMKILRKEIHGFQKETIISEDNQERSEIPAEETRQ